MEAKPRPKILAKALERGLEFFEEFGEPNSLREFEKSVQKFASGSERFGKLKVRVEAEEESSEKSGGDPFEWPATESSVWIDTGSVGQPEEGARSQSPQEVPPSSSVAASSLDEIFSQPITGSSVSVVRPTVQVTSVGEAGCDFRGNRVSTPLKGWYLILRSPDVGPEPGLYFGSWSQLTSACLPEKKLPQMGYGYRKVASREDPAAEKAWRDQGHRRAIPAFHL